MRRATTMAFAPRMHVYPGGKVDDADYASSVVLSVGEARLAQLAARASTDAAGLTALYSCALREVQEETGVMLVEPGADGSLLVDPDRIPLADHWVTPEMEPLRYDVRFFIAEVPVGQQAHLTTTEADGAFWMRPAAALEVFAAGDMALLPPTEVTLRYLAGFAEVESVLVDAAARPVIPLLPRPMQQEDGRIHWVMTNDRTGEVLP